MKQFSWEEFKKKQIAVHCKTVEEADSISNAEKEFRKAIDDYIDMLKYYTKI